jgi:hypothetical protein
MCWQLGAAVASSHTATNERRVMREARAFSFFQNTWVTPSNSISTLPCHLTTNLAPMSIRAMEAFEHVSRLDHTLHVFAIYSAAIRLLS